MTIDDEITIRAARPGEEEIAIAGYEWLFEPPGSLPESWDPALAATALRSAIDSERAEILIAVPAATSGRIAGICAIYLDIVSVRFGQRAWVEDLAVDPALRSLGIGSRLLGAARAWARERGATHLELDSAEARVDAHRFYEREGSEQRSFSFRWPL